MANGAHGKIRDGRFPSSAAAAPFSFRKVGNRREAHLEIDPVEQATILEAVDCVLNRGMSAEQTAQWLNDRNMLPRGSWRKVNGVSTHVPSKWTGHKVRLYLGREPLIGTFRWGSGRFATRSADGSLKYGGEVVMAIPQVITPETQQAVMKALSVFGPRTEDELVHPWALHVESGCGRLYTGTFRANRGVRTLRCQGKHIRRGEQSCDCPWVTTDGEDGWDARAWRAVVEQLGDAASLEAMARSHLALTGERAESAAEQRAELVAEAASRRSRLQETASALFRANVDPEIVASTVKAEQEAVEALERRAADIAAFIRDGRKQTDALDQVASLAEHFAGTLPDLDPAGQKLVICTLGLYARFDDPADVNGPVTITSRRGIDALHALDVHTSSTEA
jgi:hypothetical protein